MNITIIHDNIISNTPDSADTFVQVENVEKTLLNLGHQVHKQKFDINTNIKTDLIFNLVESINGSGKNIYFAPAFYELIKIPYTGVNAEAMAITTNKILTKIILKYHNINTPKWNEKFEVGILKPCYEDASFDLDEHSIVNMNDKIEIKKDYFCEEFIDGREINVSILEINDEPVVLPIAEIVFENFDNNKPKIVGYKAKWDENSFEYKNTNRKFVNDLENLKNIAKNVWKIFKLNGYARIDFRVDKNNIPYILEINANPCISPNAGFFSACEKFGMTYEDMIKNICKGKKC